MIYVLDACALIAMLNAEEGGKKVNGIFEQAFDGNVSIAMSIVNLIEVYYGYVRDKGRQIAIELLTPIYNTPLKIIDRISPFVYEEAARLKGTYKRISLADAIGIATATEISGQFVTSDHHELEIVDKQEATKFFRFRQAQFSRHAKLHNFSIYALSRAANQTLLCYLPILR